MLGNFINWLSRHPWINLSLLIGYFLSVVLPHERFGEFITELFFPYTRDSYDRVLLLIAIGVLSLYLFLLFKNKTEHTNKQIGFYLIINILLTICCFNYLFVVNVEAIHFLQYGIFAFLLFPLVNNYTLTLIYTTIAGAVDEAYQFYYLSPERTEYYDFNDIIINLVGAVFGLLLIRSLMRSTNVYTFRQLLKSKHLYFLMSLFVLIMLMFFTGILVKSYDPQDLVAKFWLIRKPVEGFWSVNKMYNFHFHVVQPWEGLCIVFGLLLFYSRLYRGVPIFDKN